MEKYNFDNNRIINEDFYPQTNFYFINKNKIDYLNDQEYINETYKQLINTPEFNGKPWEYIPNWSCEYFLKQCVMRNNLSKEHLICQDSYLKLIDGFPSGHGPCPGPGYKLSSLHGWYKESEGLPRC